MSYCIAIVGRANVGKSSLFNTLCDRRIAIVDPTPGVTRDRLSRELPISGERSIEIVDTGGVGMESAAELVEDVELQIEIAIARADLVLFVVDAKHGLHSFDRSIAQRLRSAGKDVLLIANKAENRKSNQNTLEFFELGFGEPISVSAAHKIGISTLKENILAKLNEYESSYKIGKNASPDEIKIALIGQRNVGKSTLINYLAQERRVVVSEIPGTTRDSIDVRFDYWDGENSQRFVAVDTAGVRRKKQLKESVDFYSQVRTHKAVKNADVVVHLFDAQKNIAKVDKQWGELVLDCCKPAILAINKMDLVPDGVEDEFVDYIWETLPGMRYSPVIFTSAKTGENVFQLLELVTELNNQSKFRVRTNELNEIMDDIVSKRPVPSKTNKRGKILFATQVDVEPPSVALFVNDSANITNSYQRYIENELRAALPFSDIPVRLMVRRRNHSLKT